MKTSTANSFSALQVDTIDFPVDIKMTKEEIRKMNYNNLSNNASIVLSEAEDIARNSLIAADDCQTSVQVADLPTKKRRQRQSQKQRKNEQRAEAQRAGESKASADRHAPADRRTASAYNFISIFTHFHIPCVEEIFDLHVQGNTSIFESPFSSPIFMNGLNMNLRQIYKQDIFNHLCEHDFNLQQNNRQASDFNLQQGTQQASEQMQSIQESPSGHDVTSSSSFCPFKCSCRKDLRATTMTTTDDGHEHDYVHDHDHDYDARPDVNMRVHAVGLNHPAVPDHFLLNPRRGAGVVSSEDCGDEAR